MYPFINAPAAMSRTKINPSRKYFRGLNVTAIFLLVSRLCSYDLFSLFPAKMYLETELFTLETANDFANFHLVT